MKFLHTADLHAGARVCEFSMTDDLRGVLSEISEIAVREQCDAVVAAGDIYDRSMPPAAAVAVFDEFVTKLADNGIAVIAVYGNHDSPERVGYLSGVAAKSGVFFSPAFDGKVTAVEMNDGFGKVNFYLLPFIRPIQAERKNECGEIGGADEETARYDADDYDGAVGSVIDGIELCGEHHAERNVLVAHLFAADCRLGEVGGIGAVSPSRLEKFDYAALGHLHGCGKVGDGGQIWYSGSPLKYSFAEVDDRKSVNIVELREKGNITVRREYLHPRHDMREVRGSFDDIVHNGLHEDESVREDYIRAILTDETDVPDAAAKLRFVYPNLMRISYDNSRTAEYERIDRLTSLQDALSPTERLSETERLSGTERMSEAELFGELYEMQHGCGLSDDARELVAEIFDKLRS